MQARKPVSGRESEASCGWIICGRAYSTAERVRMRASVPWRFASPYVDPRTLAVRPLTFCSELVLVRQRPGDHVSLEANTGLLLWDACYRLARHAAGRAGARPLGSGDDELEPEPKTRRPLARPTPPCCTRRGAPLRNRLPRPALEKGQELRGP